jgi:hypothetical protein
VHAELLRRLTLIAAVTRENLKDVLLLKLTHRVGISNTGGMHLEYEVVEFAFQSRVSLLWNGLGPWLGSN